MEIAACKVVSTEQSIPASMTVKTTSSSHSNIAALHASINKWSGLASADQTHHIMNNTGTVPLNYSLSKEEVMQKQQIFRHEANGVISVQSSPPSTVASNIHLQHLAGGSDTGISSRIQSSPPSQDEIQQISFNALNKYCKRSNSFFTWSTGDINSLLTSSTPSSCKIHRSASGSSAHAACNFENLRLKAQTEKLNNISIRNQSLDAHNRSGLYSSTKLTSMANETFSIVPIDSTHHRATEKGRLSSNPLLNTMLTSQSSNAGSTAAAAAAKFVVAVQKIRDYHLTSTKNIEAASVIHKPIQVQAEEYAAPAIIDRTMLPPTNLKTGIISAVSTCINDKFVRPSTTPLDIVKKAFASRGFSCNTKPSMDMENGYFVNPTDMYDQEMVTAIRSNDIECLTMLHASGINLQCGNRFGETLIHLACRRSSKDLVSYLINDAGVSLRVRDDFGRTPAHDACWRAEANLPLLDMLLDQAPELLMLTDKRGHTPLCYSRREHWGVLIPFLEERIDKFSGHTSLI